MKTPTVSAMLRDIQSLIERETGAPLADTGHQRLEQLLNDAVRHSVGLSETDTFSPREVTVLLTDLRGFTSISETHPAPVLLEMLNRYLVKMSEIAIQHGGTIDKFMGDAIMVLFGAPFSHAEDVTRAVTCAVDMQLALFEINAYHRTIGMPELIIILVIVLIIFGAGRLPQIGEGVGKAAQIHLFQQAHGFVVEAVEGVL